MDKTLTTPFLVSGRQPQGKANLHNGNMKKNYHRQWNRIPRVVGAIREECLDAESLEFVLLSASQNRGLYDTFEEHFLTCERCQRRIRVLQAYYRILEAELRRPVSPKVVQMARKLAEPVE